MRIAVSSKGGLIDPRGIKLRGGGQKNKGKRANGLNGVGRYEVIVIEEEGD
jgi:hypothetical protein